MTLQTHIVLFLFFFTVLILLPAFTLAALTPMGAAQDKIESLSTKSQLECTPKALAYCYKKSGTKERFELHAGDAATSNDAKAKRERVERRDNALAKLGAESTYKFSLAFDPKANAAAGMVILGQWHDGTGPSISNRCDKGTCWVDLRPAQGKTTKKIQLPLSTKSTALMYKIVWAKDATGSLELWADGKKIAEHKGQTLASDAKHPPYFKYGIYRPRGSGKNVTAEFADYSSSTGGTPVDPKNAACKGTPQECVARGVNPYATMGEFSEAGKKRQAEFRIQKEETNRTLPFGASDRNPYGILNPNR
jgi:hypothetical protein